MYSMHYLYSDWEPYYAWLPTRTRNGQWYWFKWIYRREYLFRPLWCHGHEYATIFDLVKQS